MPDQAMSDNPIGAFGPNEWLVDELYEQWLADKDSVDRAWWEFFEDYRPGHPSGALSNNGAAAAPASAPAPAPAIPVTQPPRESAAPAASAASVGSGSAAAAPAAAAPPAPAEPAAPAAPAAPATQEEQKAAEKAAVEAAPKAEEKK